VRHGFFRPHAVQRLTQSFKPAVLPKSVRTRKVYGLCRWFIPGAGQYYRHVGNPPPNEQCTAPRLATTLRENLLFFLNLGAFWCAKNQLRGIPKTLT